MTATCRYFKSISHNLTFRSPDHYPKQGWICALNLLCFIIARLLEREKKKLIKISGNLKLVVLCIVKIPAIRKVKQPTLLLAPASLGLSGSGLVKLGSRMSQVQTLGPTCQALTLTHTHIHICVHIETGVYKSVFIYIHV